MSGAYYEQWQELFAPDRAGTAELFRAEKQLRSGIQHYGSAEICRIFQLQNKEEKTLDAAGCKLIFLLPPTLAEPHPGDRIKLEGDIYTLSTVKACRSISGRNIAWRCTVD